jgi:chromodomain-helicase-DNA-binding protein 1
MSCRFKADETALNKNLAEMDLDDILNKADEHETVGEANAGATSLGGEGFLHQMAIVSDVKADLSLNWDDIIPLEDRRKFEEEEERERQEREAQVTKDSAGRKRAAAMVEPGAYEGMDGVDAPPPTPAAKKAKNPAPMRKTAAQRAVKLKEHDLRVLVRSLQRWGDIRLRYSEIVCIMFRIIFLCTAHLGQF